jgi:3-oxoacyl-[acyl-carrier protein] reductase
LKGESAYVASKAGVEAFSRTFAKEVAPFNITVNCIAPGPIRTPLLKGITNKQIQEIIKRQIITKEMSFQSVVKMVKILLDSNSSELTGQVLHIGGVY